MPLMLSSTDTYTSECVDVEGDLNQWDVSRRKYRTVEENLVQDIIVLGCRAKSKKTCRKRARFKAASRVAQAGLVDELEYATSSALGCRQDFVFFVSGKSANKTHQFAPAERPAKKMQHEEHPSPVPLSAQKLQSVEHARRQLAHLVAALVLVERNSRRFPRHVAQDHQQLAHQHVAAVVLEEPAYNNQAYHAAQYVAAFVLEERDYEAQTHDVEQYVAALVRDVAQLGGIQQPVLREFPGGWTAATQTRAA